MAPYFAQSRPHVAKRYANVKAGAYLKGPLLLRQAGARFVEIREGAAHDLWEIQQQKLFRPAVPLAGREITLPGVRHTGDFQQWEQYPDHCPWLPSLTAGEVYRYETYLRSDAYVPGRNWHWQHHSRFRRMAERDAGHSFFSAAEAADEDDYYVAQRRDDDTQPAWYAYHDAATGHLARHARCEGRVLHHHHRNRQGGEAGRPARSRRHGRQPALAPVYRQGDCTPYFEQFEAPAKLPRLLRWYEADRADDRHSYLHEATHWIARALKQQPTLWPIAAHADWRQAIIAAGMRVWGHQLAEVLTEVWQEQEQNRALGLPITGPRLYEERKPFEDLDWTEEESYHPKFILRGRELAGEPRDFNS